MLCVVPVDGFARPYQPSTSGRKVQQPDSGHAQIMLLYKKHLHTGICMSTRTEGNDYNLTKTPAAGE
jgi:hypothetical protein